MYKKSRGVLANNVERRITVFGNLHDGKILLGTYQNKDLLKFITNYVNIPTQVSVNLHRIFVVKIIGFTDQLSSSTFADVKFHVRKQDRDF